MQDNQMLINCIFLVVFFILLYYFLFNTQKINIIRDNFEVLNSDLCSEYEERGEYCPFKLHYLGNQKCECPKPKNSNQQHNTNQNNSSQTNNCDCKCNSQNNNLNNSQNNSQSNSTEFDLNSEYWKPEYQSRRLPFYPWWSNY